MTVAMPHRYAVDYGQYYGPPEEHLRKLQGDDFYIPFLQPVWNDPQHNFHVKRWHWLLDVGSNQDDDSDLKPIGEPTERAQQAERP